MDGLQGPQEHRLESESGDFVIRRRDGLIAYHLAVTVDDYDQGITHVVRGIDLLDSTPRHIWLQRQLGLPSPAYMHIPVAISPEGQKLSKLTGAAGIDTRNPGPTLYRALSALGQSPPEDLEGESTTRIWDWCLGHWNAGVLAGRQTIDAMQFGYG